MEIITKKGESMQDGVAIQIEDWSDVYPNLHAGSDTLAAYPVVANQVGMSKFEQEAYRPGVSKMRVTYQFPNAESCEAAFSRLTGGEKKLSDYKRYAAHDSKPYLGNVELD